MLEINKRDKFLYEHLTLIINEFEDAALNSTDRDALLVLASGPLTAMDAILESSSKALSLSLNTKKSANTESTTTKTGSNSQEIFVVTENPQSGDSDGFLNLNIPTLPSVTLNTEAFNEFASVDILGSENALVDLSAVEFDDDLKSLTGVDNLHDYLKDCVGCDARISFAWQLQPIDLLGSVSQLIKAINLSLDRFEKQMNPFAVFENLCDVLNGINWLCLPDLIAILASLKLLLRSYLTAQVQLNIDWTVLIAPLLKTILDAIGSLLQAIAGTLVGPLDCVAGALKSIAELQKQLGGTVAAGVALGQRVAERGKQAKDIASGNSVTYQKTDDINANILYKDVAVVPGDVKANGLVDVKMTNSRNGSTIDMSVPDLVSLDVRTRTGQESQAKWSEWSFPSGVQLDANIKLPEALNDPRFDFAHWTTKLILVINEAKQYIMELVRKIIGSLNSIEGLVTGGLSVQLGNLGLILFIKDMISLIVIITRLLQENRNINDWCSFLKEHPEVLEDMLTNTKIDVSDNTLILSQGPRVVGSIKTCLSDTSSDQKNILNQWIKDLGRTPA